jgi:hypothetical protein
VHEETVVVDPRTMRPVTTKAECHLIPKCFGVSNKTVRLDGPFDNKIGEECDSQLHAFYQLLVGEDLSGRFAFEGGSKTVAGSVGTRTQQFRIKKPAGGTATDWFRRALGTQDGQVRIEGFVTPSVDMAKAGLSMINSAFLVLYYLGKTEIYGSDFDLARALLGKVCAGTLDNSDLPAIVEMTPDFGVVLLSEEKTRTVGPIRPCDIRWYYDPSLDCPDGLMDDFPKNCIVEEGSSLVVRLPYGKCLRGSVRFPSHKVVDE